MACDGKASQPPALPHSSSKGTHSGREQVAIVVMKMCLHVGRQVDDGVEVADLVGFGEAAERSQHMLNQRRRLAQRTGKGRPGRRADEA